MVSMNKIMEYLRSDRRGRKANRLEREALSDPFMFEALEGLAAADDSAKALENLSLRLQKRVKGNWHITWKGWAVSVAVCLMGVFVWWVLPHREIQPQMVGSVASIHQKKGLERKVTSRSVIAKSTQDTGVVAAALSDSSEAEEKGDEMALTSVASKNRAVFSASGNGEMLVKVENSVEGGPMPVGGLEAFDRYIRNSMVYPEDALKGGLQGDIRLSFIVNQNGRPSRIRVVEWITHSCNREAIRLLNAGPEWTYTGSDEVTYLTISFRLPSVGDNKSK